MVKTWDWVCTCMEILPIQYSYGKSKNIYFKLSGKHKLRVVINTCWNVTYSPIHIMKQSYKNNDTIGNLFTANDALCYFAVCNMKPHKTCVAFNILRYWWSGLICIFIAADKEQQQWDHWNDFNTEFYQVNGRRLKNLFKW